MTEETPLTLLNWDARVPFLKSIKLVSFVQVKSVRCKKCSMLRLLFIFFSQLTHISTITRVEEFVLIHFYNNRNQFLNIYYYRS